MIIINLICQIIQIKKIYKSKKSYTTQYNDKDYKQEITTHINKNEE